MLRCFPVSSGHKGYLSPQRMRTTKLIGYYVLFVYSKYIFKYVHVGIYMHIGAQQPKEEVLGLFPFSR